MMDIEIIKRVSSWNRTLWKEENQRHNRKRLLHKQIGQ